ncbi:MAG: YqiA/YcfP family alpha/beta fold hydrolase [Pseudomonadota bacterium]|nr:YqiA/YcfP family alpha/beta fold hydrolase [Pseudomonadota bacterium]
MALHIVFSHGQESGPWGTKIKIMASLASSLSCDVSSIDYQGIKEPQDRVAKLIKECSVISEPICLVGSSMGGFVATAAAYDVKAIGLFVLAPAYFIQGFDHSLIKSIDIPMEIVHGWNDNIVPVENSIRYAQSQHAKLHILDGDHGLTANIQEINNYFEIFIEQFL